MKQYVIDELRPEDNKKIKKYLDQNLYFSGIDGIYWIHLDQELLNAGQLKHTQCQPFYCAVNLKPNQMACELLVRSENRIKCNCIDYATERQRNWLIQHIDSLFHSLEIKI
jgi:hypothetical protein